MPKQVTTHTMQIADTVRLDLPAGAEILGVVKAPKGISILALGLSEQEHRRVRHFRIVMSDVAFESDVAEEYIGSVVFGAAEVYHVFEIPPPDRGGREKGLGLS